MPYDRKVKAASDRPSRCNRSSIYDQRIWETAFEGISLGHDDAMIINVLRRIYPDSKVAWTDKLRSYRSRFKAAYPDHTIHKNLPELAAILEKHGVTEECKNAVLLWVNPRLRSRLGASFDPPRVKACPRCQNILPVTEKYWRINKSGQHVGQTNGACRLCQSKIWVRRYPRGTNARRATEGDAHSG